MTTKKERPITAQDGELSEEQLDSVAGGQEIRKLDPITVTAKRPAPATEVVKLDKVVVTAKREKPDFAGTQIASSEGTTRKN